MGRSLLWWSRFWAGRDHRPVELRCSICKQHWSPIYMGSRGICFECWTLETAPPDMMPRSSSSNFAPHLVRDGRIPAGHHRTRHRPHVQILRAVCPVCGGLCAGVLCLCCAARNDSCAAVA